MNNLSWRLSLAAICAVLTMFGRVTPGFAAEDDRGGPGDRLDRLERSVHEMAQHQEQLMQRLGAAQGRQGPMVGPGQENFRPPMAGSGRRGMGQPTPPMGGPPAMGVPEPGAMPAHPTQGGKAIHDLVGLIFLVALLFNILAAIWIYTDIRKRGEGPAIFIAMALVAGIPATLIYAVVRIGDKKT
ncbi:MAG: hypothetical protein WCK27_31445 [Verrucomicrobiota bacterium]